MATAQNATIFLKPFVGGNRLKSARGGEEPDMHKMNFEQTSPAIRDVRGPSGVVLLLVSLVTCTIWALEQFVLQGRL